MPEDIKPNPTPQGNDDKNKNINPTGAGEPPKDGEPKLVPIESLNALSEKNRTLKTQLDEILKKQKDADEQKLVDEGKTKELLQKREEELAGLRTKYETTTKGNAIRLVALQLGAIDTDTILKIVDLSSIKLNDDGNVDEASVKALIEETKANKPFLFTNGGTTPKNIGASGGNPPAGADKKPTFLRSQLKDGKFFADNKEAIMDAMKEGRILEG